MQKISYVKTNSFYIERYTLKKPQANMHYHHAYELYYIIEGEREYFIGDTFFKVNKGDLVWVPANMLHRTDGKGATRILLYFKPEFINKYFQQPMLKKLLKQEPFIFRADAANDKQLNVFINRLLLEYNKHEKASDKADETLLAGYLFQILFLIYTAENNYVPNIPEDNRTSQIIKYINENYAHISCMEEIADKFFISKFYLCRIFKESIGVSFISYLNTIRIKAACELLKTEDLFLSEIAIRCGFNSTPYFCKVFKDEKGVSPSEYRNSAK
ncbi:MAG: helix-turn-helix domain-containing protein [Clostridia bacterium]|nr:helix-turn-helix domain-containing protein [Clostridia bacterium]